MLTYLSAYLRADPYTTLFKIMRCAALSLFFVVRPTCANLQPVETQCGYPLPSGTQPYELALPDMNSVKPESGQYVNVIQTDSSGGTATNLVRKVEIVSVVQVVAGHNQQGGSITDILAVTPDQMDTVNAAKKRTTESSLIIQSLNIKKAKCVPVKGVSGANPLGAVL